MLRKPELVRRLATAAAAPVKRTWKERYAGLYDHLKPAPKQKPEPRPMVARPPQSAVAAAGFPSAMLVNVKNVNPFYDDSWREAAAQVDASVALKEGLEKVNVAPYPRGGSGNYPIGGFLNDLKKAHGAQLSVIRHRSSKLIMAACHVLYEQRLIRGYKSVPPAEVEVWLRHSVTGHSLIKGIDLISKPSKKVFATAAKLKTDARQNRHRNFLLVSTSQGVMTAAQAAQRGQGGQILARVHVA